MNITPGRWRLLAFATALLLFAVLAGTFSGIEAWQDGGAGSADDLEGLVKALFEDHVVALEVLGILLTAAMIGALVIARPLLNPPDSAHYMTPSDDDVKAAQAAADPAKSTLGQVSRREAAEAAAAAAASAGAASTGTQGAGAVPGRREDE
jgi:hypothetical protein